MVKMVIQFPSCECAPLCTCSMVEIVLAPVVQTLDSAIHRINHYPGDKYDGNQLRYPLDSDLSSGWRYPTFEQPGPGRVKFII